MIDCLSLKSAPTGACATTIELIRRGFTGRGSILMRSPRQEDLRLYLILAEGQALAQYLLLQQLVFSWSCDIQRLLLT